MKIKYNRVILDNASVFTPLINAVPIPELTYAHDILFINGNLLNFHKILGQCFFVSMKGSDTGLIEALGFFSNRALNELVNIAKGAVPQLLKMLAAISVQSGIEIKSLELNDETAKMLVVKAVSDLQNQKEFPELIKLFTPYFSYGAQPILEVIVVELYKYLLNRVQKLREVLPNINKTADSLRKLGMTWSIVRISFCKNCNNYDLSLSPVLQHLDNCPKCGKEINSIILDALHPSFNILKISNYDMSVFIYKYITSNIIAPIDVYPEAFIECDELKAQVDVLIIETNTAIECRCLENPKLASDAKIDSTIGNMMEKILLLDKFDFKKFVCISNFTLQDTDIFEKKLREVALSKTTNIKEIQVIGWNLRKLHDYLQQEKNAISKHSEKAMTNLFISELKDHEKKITHDKENKDS